MRTLFDDFITEEQKWFDKYHEDNPEIYEFFRKNANSFYIY